MIAANKIKYLFFTIVYSVFVLNDTRKSLSQLLTLNFTKWRAQMYTCSSETTKLGLMHSPYQCRD